MKVQITTQVKMDVALTIREVSRLILIIYIIIST